MREVRRLAVATCRAVPELDGDGPLLLAALERTGLVPEVRVWDDSNVDWSSYPLVLVRSVWDYTRRRSQFLSWAAGCRRTANPKPVLAWNTDKRYLTDLAAAEVPIVPTVFVKPGEPVDVPADWHHGDVVVKPTVSASAADAGRYSVTSGGWEQLVERLHGHGRTVIVQPYLPGVETEGETALVYLGGHFSHAVRKSALLLDQGERPPVVGDAAQSFITPATASAQQLALAARALAAVPGGAESLSYARVDVVPDLQGRPVLLELELTEPSLFLQHAPQASLDRLASYVAVRSAP
ncbi:MAG: hypothetical protein M3P83_10195 [Actinomycetota bacterium]|nr:hypothetical protein [Actinomycetota bacterium]